MRKSCRGASRPAASDLSTTAFQIAQHFAGGIVSRQAGDATARMRSGSAYVKRPNRTPVIRKPQYWPRAEKLIERQRAVENVAADQAERSLQIERREHHASEDAAAEVGCIAI